MAPTGPSSTTFTGSTTRLQRTSVSMRYAAAPNLSTTAVEGSSAAHGGIAHSLDASSSLLAGLRPATTFGQPGAAFKPAVFKPSQATTESSEPVMGLLQEGNAGNRDTAGGLDEDTGYAATTDDALHTSQQQQQYDNDTSTTHTTSVDNTAYSYEQQTYHYHTATRWEAPEGTTNDQTHTTTTIPATAAVEQQQYHGGAKDRIHAVTETAATAIDGDDDDDPLNNAMIVEVLSFWSYYRNCGYDADAMTEWVQQVSIWMKIKWVWFLLSLWVWDEYIAVTQPVQSTR